MYISWQNFHIFGRMGTFLVDMTGYHLLWLGRKVFSKLLFCSFIKIFKCFHWSCRWSLLGKGFPLINLCVYLLASQKNYTDLLTLFSVIVIDCTTNSFCMVKVLSIVYITLIQKQRFPSIMSSVIFSYILKWGTSWKELEPPGTNWNYLEIPVTRWTQEPTDTKFIRRNCSCNAIAQ